MAGIADVISHLYQKLPRFQRLTPSQVLVIGFAGLIFLGAILLSLPIASRDGQPLRFINALFTATSAVCVTGLVVVDTHDQFSLFGQLVIILLIQAGGLGIMVVSTLIALVLGRRIGLRGRILIQEAMNQFTLEGMIRLIKQVIAVTAIVEGTGALLLAFRFIPQMGFVKGLYYGVFHAVSAFCNAGFDLFGGFRSLIGYRDDVLVNLVMTSLIITGGIGFAVITDVWQYFKTKHLALNSKIVLAVTAALILIGTATILLLEWDNPRTMGDLPLGSKILSSYFQAVTPRTAGFNTLPIGDMRSATLFFIIILMFIGASPGSTGGGIKTTTFGVLVIAVWSVVRGREDSEAFGRRIPHRAVYRALAVAMISLTLVVVVTMLLSITERVTFIRVLFEATSAFGTVGLSTGITPGLTAIGKIAIILTMFAGRVGPLTIATAIAQRLCINGVKFPEERVMVG
ncbi:MAG TPA: Trk family potassium uptake protein [Firmicutes bacterium]|nr:Trk family potassium uptake protein [Bacillota bacterium]